MHEHKHEHNHDHACACTAQKPESSHECCCGKAHSDEAPCCADDGCGCGHDHGAVPEKSELITNAIKMAVSVALVFLARFVPSPTFSLVLYLVAYFLVGAEILWTAFQNICKGQIFDENFLMAVATLGAFAVGQYAEAVAVLIFYGLGETLQGMAVAKSKANIATLMDIRPEFARVEKDGVQTEMPPEKVSVGDVLLIQPGERVPLDCVVLSGAGAVDASALTGESVPVSAKEGTALSSGSVSLSGVLRCKVTSVFADSTVQKILSLVSDAAGKKAKAEKFITRFSKIYTPCVMGAAALIAVVPPLFLGWATFSEWFYRGLIFLVVSCPCALVISIPVSFLGGIGGAAKNGVLVKGGDVIDLLARPSMLVFDKTGTLTKGKFAVSEVLPANGVDKKDLLKAAAVCERSSNHPIALSIRSFCGEMDSGEALSLYEEKAGYGVLATTKNGVLAAGNNKLMAFVGADVPVLQTSAFGLGTVLHIAKDAQYLGTICIADEIKPDTKQAIAALHALGVQKCFMLTGDSEAIAQSVASTVGLDGYKAGLLPHEKVEAYEALRAGETGVCMYAGDGINDAPLLARADVGFAMGGVGSDAAIEAADVVLMTDEVSKIVSAIKVARQTRAIVKQNIVFALGVKALALLAAALGYAPMWLAIFADVGVALIAIANAARAVKLHG